jgi:murein DD-endopeptidase MepM/ murein hydrolase activator NlpD
VLRGFDDVGRYEAGHRGVDLATTAGAPVVAVAAGSVTFAGPVAGRPVVVVLHPDGLRTTYEPVDPAVTAGADVQPGQQLGTVSTPAHCAADCLHLGLRDGDVYLDPLPHLRAAAPVLLPLGRP